MDATQQSELRLRGTQADNLSSTTPKQPPQFHISYAADDNVGTNTDDYDYDYDTYDDQYDNNEDYENPPPTSTCPPFLAACDTAKFDESDAPITAELIMRRVRSMWCYRQCVPYCYEASRKPKSVKITLGLCVLLLLIVVAIPVHNSITQQLRWSKSAFERDYWNAFDINHLKHDNRAWYRHEHDSIVLHELRSSGLDEKYAAPILLQIRPPTAQSLIDDCPPGFERHALSAYIVSWFGPMSRADVVDDEVEKSRQLYCARMNDAELKDALRDPAYDLCRDPYMAACGQWVDHYGRTNGMRLNSLDPDQYNAYMHSTLAKEFSNERGLVFKTMARHDGRALLSKRIESDVAETFRGLFAESRKRTDIIADNPALFSDLVKSKAMMCALYAALTHLGERQATAALQSVCMVLNSGVDGTDPVSKCAIVRSAVDQTIRFIERELRHGDSSTACIGTLVTHGTMGDGAALQIDVPSSNPGALDPVSVDFITQAPDVARVYAMFLTLSSYYLGTEPFTGGVLFRVRTAFPLSSEAAFVGRHLERLMCVIYTENLQASYAATALQAWTTTAVKSAQNTLSDCTGVAVKMTWQYYELNDACIEKHLVDNTALLAIFVQRCMLSQRVLPREMALFDLHLPQSYYSVADKTLYFTPAYLSPPWMPASGARQLDSNLAYLFYPVLQQIYYTGNVHKASTDALTALQRCAAQRLQPSFWMDFLQMHCESNSAGRFNRRFVVSPFNRLTFDYSGNRMQDEFAIDNVVVNLQEYKHAFNCGNR